MTWKNECISFLVLLTNYHTLNGLKQHMFIISFLWAKILGMALLAFWPGSPKATVRCWAGLCFHLESHWAESVSKLTQVVGTFIFMWLCDWWRWLLSGCCWRLPSGAAGDMQFPATWPIFLGSSHRSSLLLQGQQVSLVWISETESYKHVITLRALH